LQAPVKEARSLKCYGIIHPFDLIPFYPYNLCERRIVMAKIEVREGESIDNALRRFRKKLQRSGVLKEARRHEHYLKPSERKRRQGKRQK
jgi:small subunit ribosomal protein S21